MFSTFCVIEQTTYPPDFVVQDSLFTKISCGSSDVECAVIFDFLLQANVVFSAVSYSDSDAIFYSPDHESQSQLVFSDLVVETSLLFDENANALLNFGVQDYIEISNFTISVSYDASNCWHSRDASYGSENSDFEGAIYECSSPLIIMDNSGQIEMNGIQINVDIANAVGGIDYLFYLPSEDETYGFFKNGGM